jgi:hypothetical protein
MLTYELVRLYAVNPDHCAATFAEVVKTAPVKSLRVLPLLFPLPPAFMAYLPPPARVDDLLGFADAVRQWISDAAPLFEPFQFDARLSSSSSSTPQNTLVLAVQPACYRLGASTLKSCLRPRSRTKRWPSRARACGQPKLTGTQTQC